MASRAASFIVTRLRRYALAACAVIVLGLCAISAVRAVDSVRLEVERIDGKGWSAEGIAFDLGLPRAGVASQATITRLRWGSQPHVLRNVRIACPALELTADKVACARADLTLTLPSVGAQRLAGAVNYDRRTGAIDFDVRSARLAGGAVRLRAAIGERSWRASADAEGLDAEQLLTIARELELPVAGFSGTGRVSLAIDASGAETPQRATIMAKFDQLTANNASGTLASDKLALNARATLENVDGDWLFDVAVDAGRGQAYAQPVFLDFGVHALAAQARGRLAASGEVVAESFQLDHRGVVRADGSARVDLSQAHPVRDLRLNLYALEFPGAYTSYLQPFLVDSDFESLATSGRISGKARIEAGAPRQLSLQLANLDLDDGAQAFALRGLNGEVSWRDGDNEDSARRAGAQRSSLRWQSGSLFKLALGPGALQFTSVGRDVRLVEPSRIPLLDGAIDLESLRIRNVGLPSVAFMVDATLQPVSVAQLCRAFGWPEFGGTIGGTISKLRLREGIVTLGTTLQARVFDGQIAIKDLRLEDALGAWPRFYSSLALESLDLELVTRAFSFGRITGRLSGAIDELQLFKWQPIAFDARLYTPLTDRSRHRISQRAVQNIGSIGGGGAGITQALSGGLLRFFDDFRYDRLGWSCRLQNEVCYMDGIAPAPHGGYYLVKGSGLPRIDVIGSARRVDWPRLVQQLIAVTESEGPVVQ
jgi:hypothetical protein